MATNDGIGDDNVQRDALRILKQGGVVILPTDTLYGISVAAASRDGVERIRAIKRSQDERLFIVLASSIEMVEANTRSFGCASRELLSSLWPAPLTAILPVGTARAGWMGDTVAVRVPDVPPLLDLIAALGEPIVSTSVNRGGETPYASLSRITAEFGSEVDLIVAGESPETTAPASTIVDFTGDEPVVIRKGDFVWPPAP